MPGPMVPRPAPTPRAMPDRPFDVLWATRSGMNVRSTARSAPLVVGGGRAAEVDRGQGGEDEGLQGRYKPDFEDEEDDGDRQGDHAEGREAEQDDHAPAHEEDEQVAGEHVREEPDGQGDDPDELRDHLDEEDWELRRTGDARGDPAREVALEALGP